jgi:hypothetical protein
MKIHNIRKFLNENDENINLPNLNFFFNSKTGGTWGEVVKF